MNKNKVMDNNDVDEDEWLQHEVDIIIRIPVESKSKLETLFDIEKKLHEVGIEFSGTGYGYGCRDWFLSKDLKGVSVKLIRVLSSEDIEERSKQSECVDCKDRVIDYSKPEETPRWIIIPVFNSNQCQDKSFRQWWLSQEQGIRARGCRKKGSTKMSLQSYLFQKAKGWTMARAKEWVAQHKRSQALEAFKNYLWRG